MKIIALTLMAIIILPLASIKAAPSGSSAGGGGVMGSRGFVGSGGGDISRDTSAGYMSGKPGKPQGGGDTGPMIIVRPKPLPEEPKKPAPLQITWPAECKPEVRHCATVHIYKAGGGPYGGPCCAKFRAAEPCVCRLLTAKDPKISREANRVLGVCHMQRPVCIKVPLPKQCRPEVKHCIDVHILGGAGDPPYHGACCNKFKTSKSSCICNFHTSTHPKVRRAADGILRGCHFKRPNC